MSVTLYLPCDSSAISLGADRIATTILNEAKRETLPLN